MSSTSSWNYTDTAATAVATLQPATLDYDVDFAKKDSKAENTLIITNTTSPLDRPENIRYAVSRVNNIYSGSGLEAGFQAPNRAGVSVLVQDTTVLTVVDDAGNRYDYPFSAHLVLKVPFSEVVTDTVLNTVLNRLIGACYEKSGTSAGPRISKMIRGALTPSVMV